MRKPNEFIDHGDFLEMIVYRITGEEKNRSLISKEDKKKIEGFNWNTSSGGYLFLQTKERKFISLHLFLLGKRNDLVIDHINGNKLDNRRENLRFVTKSQNQWNSKSRRGYSFSSTFNTWKVQIRKNGKTVFIKYVKTEEIAKQTRQQAEKKYFGKFAPKR